MRRIKDPAFFEGIRDFLCVYLPKVRNVSPHTVSSYRATLSGFVSYLQHSLNYSIYNMASVFSVLIFLFVGSVTAWNLSKTRAFQED